MKVEVVYFRPISNGGSLQGFAEIKVGPVIIRDVRLVQPQGKPPFASPPQREYVGKDGEKKYQKLVEWPREWDGAIIDALLDAQINPPAPPERPQYQEREQYTPQGGPTYRKREEYNDNGLPLQDSYQSDYQEQRTQRPAPRQPAPAPPQPRQFPARRPAPVQEYDDSDLQDPFAE